MSLLCIENCRLKSDYKWIGTVGVVIVDVVLKSGERLIWASRHDTTEPTQKRVDQKRAEWAILEAMSVAVTNGKGRDDAEKLCSRC